MGYLYFDTGVMYRAVTWAVLERSIVLDQEEAISRLAENLRIEVVSGEAKDGRQYTVLVDGRDVTWEIRSPAVDEAVSQVAAYPRVRAALTAQQRRIAAGGGVVMVGRDIGTVVLPGADLKLFMRASPEKRAWRRYQEVTAQGKTADYNQILAAIRERDRRDEANPISPLIPATEAIIIDTDNLSLVEMLAWLEEVVAQYNRQAESG